MSHQHVAADVEDGAEDNVDCLLPTVLDGNYTDFQIFSAHTDWSRIQHQISATDGTVHWIRGRAFHDDEAEDLFRLIIFRVRGPIQATLIAIAVALILSHAADASVPVDPLIRWLAISSSLAVLIINIISVVTHASCIATKPRFSTRDWVSVRVWMHEFAVTASYLHAVALLGVLQMQIAKEGYHQWWTPSTPALIFAFAYQNGIRPRPPFTVLFFSLNLLFEALWPAEGYSKANKIVLFVQDLVLSIVVCAIHIGHEMQAQKTFTEMVRMRAQLVPALTAEKSYRQLVSQLLPPKQQLNLSTPHGERKAEQTAVVVAGELSGLVPEQQALGIPGHQVAFVSDLILAVEDAAMRHSLKWSKLIGDSFLASCSSSEGSDANAPVACCRFALDVSEAIPMLREKYADLFRSPVASRVATPANVDDLIVEDVYSPKLSPTGQHAVTEWGSKLNRVVHLRIGIDCGEVCEVFPSSLRARRQLTGAAVQVALKLLRVCPVGDITVTSRVDEALQSLSFSQAGEFTRRRFRSPADRMTPDDATPEPPSVAPRRVSSLTDVTVSVITTPRSARAGGSPNSVSTPNHFGGFSGAIPSPAGLPPLSPPVRRGSGSSGNHTILRRQSRTSSAGNSLGFSLDAHSATGSVESLARLRPPLSLGFALEDELVDDSVFAVLNEVECFLLERSGDAVAAPIAKPVSRPYSKELLAGSRSVSVTSTTFTSASAVEGRDEDEDADASTVLTTVKKVCDSHLQVHGGTVHFQNRKVQRQFQLWQISSELQSQQYIKLFFVTVGATSLMAMCVAFPNVSMLPPTLCLCAILVAAVTGLLSPITPLEKPKNTNVENDVTPIDSAIVVPSDEGDDHADEEFAKDEQYWQLTLSTFTQEWGVYVAFLTYSAAVFTSPFVRGFFPTLGVMIAVTALHNPHTHICYPLMLQLCLVSVITLAAVLVHFHYPERYSFINAVSFDLTVGLGSSLVANSLFIYHRRKLLLSGFVNAYLVQTASDLATRQIDLLHSRVQSVLPQHCCGEVVVWMTTSRLTAPWTHGYRDLCVAVLEFSPKGETDQAKKVPLVPTGADAWTHLSMLEEVISAVNASAVALLPNASTSPVLEIVKVSGDKVVIAGRLSVSLSKHDLDVNKNMISASQAQKDRRPSIHQQQRSNRSSSAFTAYAMLTTIAELRNYVKRVIRSPSKSDQSGPMFSFCVGIHVGPTTGALCGRNYISFELFGEGVTVSHRLCDFAAPGQALLSSELFLLADHCLISVRQSVEKETREKLGDGGDWATATSNSPQVLDGNFDRTKRRSRSDPHPPKGGDQPRDSHGFPAEGNSPPTTPTSSTAASPNSQNRQKLSADRLLFSCLPIGVMELRQNADGCVNYREVTALGVSLKM